VHTPPAGDSRDRSSSDPAVRVLVMKGAVGEALDSFLLFDEPVLTPELADQLADAVFNGWIASS
jgi:hypothetical protein